MLIFASHCQNAKHFTTPSPRYPVWNARFLLVIASSARVPSPAHRTQYDLNLGEKLGQPRLSILDTIGGLRKSDQVRIKIPSLPFIIRSSQNHVQRHVAYYCVVFKLFHANDRASSTMLSSTHELQYSVTSYSQA